MIIKLSDFILESSIDVDSTINDIAFETILAELNVNSKIMEYYLKQMNMGVDIFQEVEAEPPKDMPTKDQLMPTSSYVQSYDMNESIAAVKQALRDMGCEVSNANHGDGSVNGYFEVQSYDGGYETYRISYYPANSTVEVHLTNGYSYGNPYESSKSQPNPNAQFKINPNKNIKSQLQNIADKVNKDLQKFYTNREDYKGYKADPNNSFYRGYHDNVDVGLNEGMGNVMKNALKDNAIKGVTAVAQIVAFSWSLCRLIATIIQSLYSVLNKLKRAAGMKSRSDADAKMISTINSPLFTTRDIDTALTADLSNLFNESRFIKETMDSIDKMYYTLQAMNILTKKSNINGAEDFQNIVSAYQQIVQHAISKAQTEDMNTKRKSNANWLSDLEQLLNSDRAKAVQSMIQNISEQQFKRQMEQGLQGIDPTSMQKIMIETQKLQESVQRDLTQTRTQCSKIDQELNKLIAQSSYGQFNPNNATRTMTQPQLQTQPPTQQKSSGQMMQMQ